MKTIMHKNCMDVAFEVHEISKQKPGYYHIKGYWINLGYTGNPWVISNKETIVVSEDDFASNWVDIENKLYLPRTKPGLPE